MDVFMPKNLHLHKWFIEFDKMWSLHIQHNFNFNFIFVIIMYYASVYQMHCTNNAHVTSDVKWHGNNNVHAVLVIFVGSCIIVTENNQWYVLVDIKITTSFGLGVSQITDYSSYIENLLQWKTAIQKTRQHSTQSVGNMPPPSPPHLLPQVL